MASRRDFAALRIISATKRKAERDGEDVLFELSGGDDYFENAIRAIKNSGEINNNYMYDDNSSRPSSTLSICYSES